MCTALLDQANVRIPFTHPAPSCLKDGLLRGYSYEVIERQRINGQLENMKKQMAETQSRINVKDCIKRGFQKEGQGPQQVADQLVKDCVDVIYTIGGDESRGRVTRRLPEDEQLRPHRQRPAQDHRQRRPSQQAIKQRRPFVPSLELHGEKLDIHAVCIPEVPFDIKAESGRLARIMDACEFVNIFINEGAGVKDIIHEMEGNGDEVPRFRPREAERRQSGVMLRQPLHRRSTRREPRCRRAATSAEGAQHGGHEQGHRGEGQHDKPAGHQSEKQSGGHQLLRGPHTVPEVRSDVFFARSSRGRNSAAASRALHVQMAGGERSPWVAPGGEGIEHVDKSAETTNAARDE